jgi:hypothetical protein
LPRHRRRGAPARARRRAPGEAAASALRRTREALVRLESELDAALAWLRAPGAGAPAPEGGAARLRLGAVAAQALGALGALAGSRRGPALVRSP